MRDVVAGLGGSVFTLVAQPRVDVFAASPGLASSRVVQVGLTYSYYQYPRDRDDPRNFVNLTVAQRRAIARAEASALPPELREQIRRARYPTLFEAVRTSLPIPAERAHPLESRLEAHIVDALRGMFPGQRRPERARHARAVPLENYTIHRGIPLIVDGETLRGYRVDVAPHVIAVGARVEDRYVTAVIPTEYEPRLILSFATF